jgi:hypothetical protein
LNTLDGGAWMRNDSFIVRLLPNFVKFLKNRSVIVPCKSVRTRIGSGKY